MRYSLWLQGAWRQDTNQSNDSAERRDKLTPIIRFPHLRVKGKKKLLSTFWAYFINYQSIINSRPGTSCLGLYLKRKCFFMHLLPKLAIHHVLHGEESNCTAR